MTVAVGKSQAVLWTQGSVPSAQPVTAVLRVTLDPGWHSYWLDPGEAGSPPEVTWELPEGWKVGPALWPLPERFEQAGIMTVGYTREVRAQFVLQPPAGSQGNFEIAATVNLVVCDSECLFETHRLSTTVLIGPGPAGGSLPPPRVARPEYRTQTGAKYQPGEGKMAVEIPRLPEVRATPSYVLCETPGILDLRSPVVSWETKDGRHRAVFRTTTFATPIPDRLVFIVPANDKVAYRVEATLTKP